MSSIEIPELCIGGEVNPDCLKHGRGTKITDSDEDAQWRARELQKLIAARDAAGRCPTCGRPTKFPHRIDGEEGGSSGN